MFSVKKSAKNQAMTYQHMQVDLQNQQRDVDFGRQLLANIRQQRLASEAIRFDTYSDIGVSSSAAGAQANLASTLASEVGYAYDTGERQEKIQRYAQMEEDAWGEYAKSVAKAGMAGKIVGTVTTAVGSIVGGPIGAAVGAAIGTGITQLMGGGHVATGAAVEAGVKGTISSGISEYLGSVFEGMQAPSEMTQFQKTAEMLKEADTARRIGEVSSTVSGGYTSIYDLSQLKSSFGIWQGTQAGPNMTGLPFSSVPLYN